MGLKQKMRQSLREDIPHSLLPLLPARIPIIGYAALIRLKEELYEYGKRIGKALVDLSDQIESVWTFTGTTKGEYRIPQVSYLAGRRNPIVLHKEYGTRFVIDISRLTFSPGNTGERGKIIEMVKQGDVLVDLFACCGNLTLPSVVNTDIELIWMMEVNPLAYHYLVENIYLNHLEDIVIPLYGDNHNFNAKDVGDHVFLGFLPRPDEAQLEIGIKALKNEGGCLHYHASVKKEEKQRAVDRVKEKARKMGRHIDEIKLETVKGLSSTLVHVVVRAFLTKI